MAIGILRRLVGRLRRDERGVSAVEFALIAPAMVGMFFGIGEVSAYMQAHNRLTKVASTLADLVAQDTQINNAEINDIFNCAQAIMQPFPWAGAWARVTSVTANAAGQTTVAWSDARNTSARSPGSAIAMPAGIVPPNSSVIFAEVNFTYTSSFGMFLTQGVVADDQFYSRPRRSVTVARIP